MNIKPADRLAQFSEYYFSAKLRAIRELIAQGRPIINLGIGSPDQMPHAGVIGALQETAQSGDSHGYQPYQGLPALGDAIREFYARTYQVNARDKAVLPLLGSKEGIMHTSLAYLNPGDQVLIPALGYPTYTSVTRIVGAEPVYFPLMETSDWAPDWEFLEQLDCSKVKILWINYPHMPSGTRADKALLTRCVDFARSRNILLCHDNPYSFILNDSPLSIFNIEGAEEVAIELNSLSKSFNMAGWRVGWAMGSEKLIQPVLQIKSNMDSGMFKPVQLAAIEALNLDRSWFDGLNDQYRKRQLVGFRIMDLLNCQYSNHQAGMFVWAKAPNGDGEAFVEEILDRYDVFMAPGFIFGEAGRSYIRLSLCASVELLEEVYNRMS